MCMRARERILGSESSSSANLLNALSKSLTFSGPQLISNITSVLPALALYRVTVRAEEETLDMKGLLLLQTLSGQCKVGQDFTLLL